MLNKVLYYLIALPLEIALVISGFVVALIGPPSIYFLYHNHGLVAAYIVILLSSFGLFMVLLLESLFYLKWKALTKHEYNKVLGNRSFVNQLAIFSSDVYYALKFAVEKYSLNPNSKTYKKLARLIKLHNGFNYLLIFHVIVCIIGAILHGAVNL